MPGFWVTGALLAWAIRYHWVGGLVRRCLSGRSGRLGALGADPGQLRQPLPAPDRRGGRRLHGESLQQMAAERDAAQRAAAATAERARLARVVHDGVLQVLALVQRRGSEIGGEAAELGRLAGEQESALRALIRQQDSWAIRVDDLSPDEPSTWCGAPRWSAPRGQRRCAGRAGAGAPACGRRARCRRGRLPRQRDPPRRGQRAGLGAARGVAGPDRDVGARRGARHPRRPARQAAAADGRLGVSESIRGRIADLGGTATLTTSSAGTEWEFVVPRCRTGLTGVGPAYVAVPSASDDPLQASVPPSPSPTRSAGSAAGSAAR